MRSVYEYILFDLDGTLTQSAPGIRRCIELTMEELNKTCPDLSDYSKYIGPPLIETFQRLCKLSLEEAKKALSIYLKYYDTEGDPRNKLFDGVKDMLWVLRESSAKVALCTSKNQRSATRVCEFLGITEYFDTICGSNGTPQLREKEDIIPYAVKTLGGEITDRVVMIGDTHFDAKGAKINGVDFIGVTYGYGTTESMKKEGAEVFAKTPEELISLLLTD